MTIFHLDGRSHAVDPEMDIALIEGPGVYTGRHSGEVVKLCRGDTITLTFYNLAPGEAATITSNGSTTVFYRPLGVAQVKAIAVAAGADSG